MTDTPRTDEQVRYVPENSWCSHGGDDVVPADFARQLERELNAAKEVVVLASELCDAMYKERGEFVGCNFWPQYKRLLEMLDENGSEPNEVKQHQVQPDEVKQNQVEKPLAPQTDQSSTVVYAVFDPMYKFILEFDQLLTRLHFDESSRPELDNCIGLVLDRRFREKTN